MTINEYQKKALETSKYKDRDDKFIGCVLGLAAEAGEVAGKIEKRIRKHYALPRPTNHDDIMDVVDEFGDCMFHIAVGLDALGITLDEAMVRNVDKLASREMRGLIVGEGEKR